MIPLPDGGWSAATVLTPKAFKVRGLALMPSNSVIPIIVVPGIMGTKLRAKRQPRIKEERNQEAAPGKPAWRPPNTMPGGLWDALAWDRYDPKMRQRLLDPDTLEVDDDGRRTSRMATAGCTSIPYWPASAAGASCTPIPMGGCCVRWRRA
jgi:hypothetical protein